MTGLLILVGMLFLGSSVACFLVFRPRKGWIHPWVTKPVLAEAIPLTIIAFGIFGLASLATAFIE